jgi:hypothetical protein
LAKYWPKNLILTGLRLPQAFFALFQVGNVRAGYGKAAIRDRVIAYLKPAAVENRNVTT